MTPSLTIVVATGSSMPIRRSRSRCDLRLLANKSIARQQMGDFSEARRQTRMALKAFGDSQSRFAAYAWLHESILHADLDWEYANASLGRASTILEERGNRFDRLLVEIAPVESRLWQRNEEARVLEEVAEGIARLRPIVASENLS